MRWSRARAHRRLDPRQRGEGETTQEGDVGQFFARISSHRFRPVLSLQTRLGIEELVEVAVGRNGIFTSQDRNLFRFHGDEDWVLSMSIEVRSRCQPHRIPGPMRTREVSCRYSWSTQITHPTHISIRNEVRNRTITFDSAGTRNLQSWFYYTPP